MISESEIWRAAMVIVNRYGDDAMFEAAVNAEERLDAGDWEAALTWHRILEAVGRLQATEPTEGETVH